MSDPQSLDDEACYRAVCGKDARFDGVFYSGVSSTGIYCRPSCPAVTPKKSNLSYYRIAAAAQEAGYRACKRCRPDAAPGSPEWNVRGDLAGRTMRLIADGAIDRSGVGGLAAAVGYSERQLNRQLVSEVGVGPLALARAQRARTARILLETSSLSISDVAFAAGFSSIRQFNDTIREVFAETPSQLRLRAPGARRRGAAADPSGSITVRLAYRRPMNVRAALDFLGRRSVDGIDEYRDGTYLRSLILPRGSGVVALSIPGDTGMRARSTATGRTAWVACELWLDDLRDLTAAVQRCRRMLDLDSDPVAIDDHLARDPVLRPLVAASPGHRMPGSTDPNEVAFRVVLGQQVSTAGAKTVASRLVAAYGADLKTPVGSVIRTFPTPAALVNADPAKLAMPNSRKRAIRSLALALADESVVLSAGSDWDDVQQALLSIHGIGPWTVAAIRMRGLGDPDVFLPTDLGIQKAMSRLGEPADPKSLDARSQAWRPWRSYTTHHLWSSLDAPDGQPVSTRQTRFEGD
mgnify:CR=1 FL=1